MSTKKGDELIWNIVMMVSVFILVATILFYTFGSPECESYANKTARDLKDAINRVADPAFPTYTGDDVPSDPRYYSTSLVTMCQQNTAWSWIIQFWGGVPEYQIYYEQFPEGFFSGGAGMWTESYPWSGGAGSSLVFWGVLRAGTAAFKGLKYTNAVWSGAKSAVKLAKVTGEVGETVSKSVERNLLERMLTDPEEFEKELLKNPEIIANKISFATFSNAMKDEEGAVVITAMKDSEFLVPDEAIITKEIPAGTTIAGEKVCSGDGPCQIKFVSKVVKEDNKIKLPINNKEIPYTFTDKNEKFYVFFKDADSGGIQFSKTMTPPENGYTLLTYNPAESFKYYVDNIATPEEKTYLKGIYAVDWENSPDAKLIEFSETSTVSEDALKNSDLKKTGLVNWLKTGWEKIEVNYAKYAKNYNTGEYISLMLCVVDPG